MLYVIVYDVCYSIFLYCTILYTVVLYCPFLQCSTLPPGINTFAVDDDDDYDDDDNNNNNNNNNKVILEFAMHIEQGTLLKSG